MSTFFQDAFSGIAATLEAHTPDVGGGWVKVAGTGTSPGPNGSGALNGGTNLEEFVYLANTAPGTDAYFAQIDDSASTQRHYPAVRMDADGQCYYVKQSGAPAPGQYQLYKRVGTPGAYTDTYLGQGALAVQTSLRIAAHNVGGDVVIEAYAGPAGGAQGLVCSVTDAASAPFGGVAPFTANGKAGLIRFNLNIPADNFIAGTGTQPGITAGTISETPAPNASDETHIRLTATASAGGTAPLTYQWYRSTVPGFTPGAGTILSGETALTLVDTPPTAAVYYYRVRTTDAAAATVDSATFGARYHEAPLLLCFAGDSNYFAPPADGTETPPTQIARHMGKLAGNRTVTLVNGSESATGTAHWQPGQTTYDTAAAAFSTAIAAAQAGSVMDVLFMLGTNDAGSTSQATFESRMTTTVNALLALGFGRVILCYQAPVHAPALQTRNQALLLYQASLDTIAAANPTRVKVIGQEVYEYLFAHPEQMNQTDGIHLLARAVESLGDIQARDYAEILDPSGSFDSGGGFVYLPGGSI